MSSGFTFGAAQTTAPTFGTGSITFGTPASQPASLGFGSLPTTTPSLFGTPSATTSFGLKPGGLAAPNTGLSFGTPATTTPSFGLGAPATSFGTPATTNTGFGFKPVASTSGLTFGGAPAASTPGLTFGTPATSTALSFGAPAPSTGLSFGTPATTSALSFGTPAKTSLFSTAAPTLGLGTATTSSGFGFGATATTSAPGLSFGVATTSAPGLSFATPAPSFGTTTTGTSSGFSFGTSLGSLGTTASTSGAFSLTTATTSQNLGLGGTAFTSTKSGTSSTQKELPPKEQLLPNEFTQLVEQFKTIVQEEKNRSTEVSRCSIKEFCKVENELDLLNQQCNQIETQLMNDRNVAEKLKYDSAKGLQSIEMAQRTQDTPPSLQYDNTAPLQYFLDLADTFEREMQVLKLKIENTEKFVKKCHDPNILTSQDLSLGLKRLHETFVALAGRMQSVHSQVEGHKERFISMRRQVLKDVTNPFERVDKQVEAMNVVMKHAMKSAPPSLASGPTPFNSISLGSNSLAITQQTTPPAQTLGFGGSTSFGGAPSNTSLFQTSFGSSPFQLNTSSNFQLQKPPTGNKRGKQ